MRGVILHAACDVRVDPKTVAVVGDGTVGLLGVLAARQPGLSDEGTRRPPRSWSNQSGNPD